MDLLHDTHTDEIPTNGSCPRYVYPAVDFHGIPSDNRTNSFNALSKNQKACFKKPVNSTTVPENPTNVLKNGRAQGMCVVTHAHV